MLSKLSGFGVSGFMFWGKVWGLKGLATGLKALNMFGYGLRFRSLSLVL